MNAETNHKNKSEFGLEIVEDSLLDQRVFFLNDDQWNAFQQALNRPAEVQPGLKKLMEEKAPWE